MKKQIHIRLLSLLLALLMLPWSFALADAPEAPTPQIVVSFELYDPVANQITLLREPEVVDVLDGDKGNIILNRLLDLSDDNAIGAYIDNLTFGDTTYSGDYSVNHISWALYRNNAQDNALVNGYEPEDGDVYRVIYTPYDSGTYLFPIFPHDVNALYWVYALSEDAGARATAKSSMEAAGLSQNTVDILTESLVQSGTEHRVLTDWRSAVIDIVGYPAAETIYQLSVSPKTAEAGEIVTITLSPAAGKSLVQDSLTAGTDISIAEVDSTTYTFVMPDYPVSISAEFAWDESSVGVQSVGFFADEALTIPVYISPAFTPFVDDYEVTTYDYLYADGTSANTNWLFHTINMKDQASAQFQLAFLTGGNLLDYTDSLLKFRFSTMFASSSGYNFNFQTHSIHSVSPSGATRTYNFKIGILPTLRSLNISDDNQTLSLQGEFSPETFVYNLVVSDNTDSLQFTPTAAQTSGSTIKSNVYVNGNLTAAGGTEIITLSNSEIDEVVIDAKRSKDETISSTYTIHVYTESEYAEQWAIIDRFLAATATYYQNYTESGAFDPIEWMAMGISFYDNYAEKSTATMTATMRQSFINKAVTELAGTPSVGTIAKYALTLASIGVDPSRLTDKSGNSVNAIALLNGADISSASVYDAPIILFVHNSGLVTLSDANLSALFTTIETAQGSGDFSDYGYANYSTAGQVLAALAPFAGTSYESRVQAIIEKSLSAISSAQSASGSLGSAYDDGMVLTGLTALNIDPEHDGRFIKGGNTFIDGIMGYAADNQEGFLSYGSKDPFNTAHGLIGLVAAAEYHQLGSGAYHIYQVDTTALQPAGYQTIGSGENNNNGTGGKSIDVTFSLQGLDADDEEELWVDDLNAKTTEGATVASVIITAFNSLDGYTQTGASGGYISRVSTPSRTLKEAQSPWTNSGWMYSVNGISPAVGMKQKTVTAGDEILLYFVKDYTDGDDGIGGTSGTGTAGSQPDAPTSQFTDLEKDAWYADGVAYTTRTGLMKGISDTTFAPNETMSRAMIVAVLYRLAGEPAVTTELTYTDAEPDAWYASALQWATETDLVNGYGDGRFGINDPVTRQQLITMLYRFCEAEQYNLTAKADLSQFSDQEAVADWASTAMEWAVGSELLQGINGALSPESGSSRAQVATILYRLSRLK